MDRIGRIHELIDEIGKLAFEEFPEGTKAMVTVNADGYADFDVTEWETEKPADERKYRYLFRQFRSSLDMKWMADSSESINEYIAKDDMLLRRAEQ